MDVIGRYQLLFFSVEAIDVQPKQETKNLTVYSHSAALEKKNF